METLEIHPKDFLVKWVHVPDNSTIDWQVKPLKKSVNLAIYRKKDDEPDTLLPPSAAFGNEADSSTNGSSTPSTSGSSNGRFRSGSVSLVNKVEATNFKTKSRSLTFSENLNNSDLTLVKNHNKLIGQELVRGSFSATNGGMFAFIFDNSFSKTTGKKVLFSAKLNEPVPPMARRILTRRMLSAQTDKHIKFAESEEDSSVLRPKGGELLQSVLLKRRRKKLQGFTKRFFVLNFKYGTLSYFRQDNNKLRGQMPIKHSIVSANPKNKEFIIDSGMEVWDLKALSLEDFNTWVEAFNLIKKPEEPEETAEDYNELEVHSRDVIVRDLQTIAQKAKGGDNVYEDLEALISRLSSDAVSIYSTNEFHDARETYDTSINTGVVFLGKDDDLELAQEESEVSSDSSDDEDSPGMASSVESLGPTSAQRQKSKLTTISSRVIHEVDEDGTPTVDDAMYPLPHPPVKRQEDIAEWTLPVPLMLGFLRKNVGKDLSTIAMPVETNEPVTVLQKFSEMFEYADLIQKALKSSEAERILRIAAFAVSFLLSTRVKERNNRKPFNPLLGETFELVREDMGLRFVAEKVSHRPPVFAMFAETEYWEFIFSPSPGQKFWGKSMELITKGTAKLTVKETGEVFTWSHPNTMLKNIIAGEKYSEPLMAMTIKSSSGCKAVVEFAKSGMFSGRSEDLEVKAYDPSKKEFPATVFGKWTDTLTLKAGNTEKLIWQVGELVPDAKKKFGFTKFAASLNQVTEIEEGHLPPTDSRLRPDLRAYIDADVPNAERLKLELEENQRVRRKEMESAQKEHEPQFFRHVGNGGADTGEWEFLRGDNSYWNRRKRGDWESLQKLW